MKFSQFAHKVCCRWMPRQEERVWSAPCRNIPIGAAPRSALMRFYGGMDPTAVLAAVKAKRI